MPRGKGIYDNEETEAPKGGRPAPNDDSGDGGTATPDVDESSEEPTA